MIVVVAAPSAWGGAERHTVDLVQSLDAAGLAVRIYEIGSGLYLEHKAEIPPKVDVIGRTTELLRSGRDEWRRVADSWRARVIIVPKGSFYTLPLRSLAAMSRASRLVTIEHSLAMHPQLVAAHEDGDSPWSSPFFLAKSRLVAAVRARTPHVTVCVSDAVRDRLKALMVLSLGAGTLQTVRNGVSVERFRHSAESRIRQRRGWGIADDAVVFGAVTRLAPEKQLQLAMRAFEGVWSEWSSRDGAPPWLILVGEGPEKTNLERERLKLRSRDHIRIVGATDEPAAAFSGLDFSINSSAFEGLPLSVLESMACECPPIAFAVGGIPEVISSDEVGFLVARRDVGGLAAAMRDATRLGIDGRRRLGALARKRVSEHFEARNAFATIVNIVQSQLMISDPRWVREDKAAGVA